MQPNKVKKKLGYQDDARLVIIHADDIGMCQSSVAAYADLIDVGLISSAATMVPCSWFPATASYCREHPAVDMGVHLTLTSEWDSYRWGPISTRDKASGLMDDEGCFFRSTLDAQQHGDGPAVQAEINAQIKRALDAGIDVTHIDTHMGTVYHPKYLPFYVQAAVEHRLPLFIGRWDEVRLRAHGMDDEVIASVVSAVAELEKQGIPLLDSYCITSLGDSIDTRLDHVKQLFKELPSGITHYIIHPSKDTPELRAIAPDWRARVADYEAFMNDELRSFIRDEGIHIIGYRALRDLMRG